MLAKAVVVDPSLRPMGATAMHRGEVDDDNRGIARPTLPPLLGGEWLVVNALAHAKREHSTTMMDFMVAVSLNCKRRLCQL
jgi:hypothetical protein